MKLSHSLLAGCVGLLVLCAPSPTAPGRSNSAYQTTSPNRTSVRPSAHNLDATVCQLQSTPNPHNFAANREAVGTLWMDVDRLRGGGHNVRAIEYYVSDLEQRLRRGNLSGSERRRLLNNLEYETDALNRRLRTRDTGKRSP